MAGAPREDLDGEPAPRTASHRRPTGVKVIVALGVLQSLLLIAIGAAFLVSRTDPDLLADFETTSTPLAIAGAVLVALGLATGVLAVLLARGSEGARSFFGAITTLQVALAVFTLVGHRDIEFDSIWGLAVPIVLLWLLYGSNATQEYFER